MGFLLYAVGLIFFFICTESTTCFHTKIGRSYKNINIIKCTLLVFCIFSILLWSTSYVPTRLYFNVRIKHLPLKMSAAAGTLKTTSSPKPKPQNMASFSMLNFDEAKNSYIEEEDRTYIYNTTNEGVSSEEEDDDEAEDDDESENQGLSRKALTLIWT